MAGKEKLKAIQPLSVVKLISDHPGWQDVAGRTFRIGFYSRQDGLQCVWLVDESGDYMRTVDQQHIVNDFEILSLSSETEMFDVDRPVIEPL